MELSHLISVVRGWSLKSLHCLCGCLTIGRHKVLGVSPIEGFDMIKAAYTRKRKEAEKRGDEATAAEVCYISNL